MARRRRKDRRCACRWWWGAALAGCITHPVAQPDAGAPDRRITAVEVKVPPHVGGSWTAEPWAPVPPELGAAMELRALQPEVAARRLEQLHGRAVKRGDARLAALALHRAADVAVDLESPFVAESLYLRALALHQLRGDRLMEGVAANDLGLLDAVTDATPWFRHAVDVRRDAGDLRGLRVSLTNLGARLLYDDPPAAVEALEEALALAIEGGEDHGRYRSALLLAQAHERRARQADGGRDGESLAIARAWLEEAAAIASALGEEEDPCASLAPMSQLCGEGGGSAGEPLTGPAGPAAPATAP